MAVIWRERKADGTEVVIRYDFEAGTEEVLQAPPRNRKETTGKRGYWQLSESNGIIGSKKTVKKAAALDAQLGVGSRVDYVQTGPNAWKAGFRNKADKKAWLKAHKRVDLDAGYSDPAPGDFRGNVPNEFEGMKF